MSSGRPLSAAWRRFRRAVLDERGWRCERCGRSGRLELHHVRPVSEGGAEFDPENVEILCRTCHVEHHRKPNDPERAAWRGVLADIAAGAGTNPERPPGRLPGRFSLA